SAASGAPSTAPKPQAVALNAPPAPPVKTVDVWRRELRSLPAPRAYETVISDNTVEAYEAYVSLYNTPPLGPRVRGLLDRRHEMIAWYIAVTVNSSASFQVFLAKYPSGDLAPTAARLLERART